MLIEKLKLRSEDSGILSTWFPTLFGFSRGRFRPVWSRNSSVWLRNVIAYAMNSISSSQKRFKDDRHAPHHNNTVDHNTVCNSKRILVVMCLIYMLLRKVVYLYLSSRVSRIRSNDTFRLEYLAAKSAGTLGVSEVSWRQCIPQVEYRYWSTSLFRSCVPCVCLRATEKLFRPAKMQS